MEITGLSLEAFEYAKFLGKGFLGRTFLVVEKETQYPFVLKAIIKEDLIKMKLVKQIKLEIEMHSHLKHPNIIEFYTYFQDKDAFWLVLEYAPYGDLFQYIQQKGRLNDQEASNIIYQMAQALFYLHKQGIIHRDIKLENILITDTNQYKLGDFGWSAQIKPQQMRKTFCGTYEYIPPEMHEKIPYSTASDCWSLGILTYELLHGYTPFLSNNNSEIKNNILRNQPLFNQDISLEAKDFILKLLKTNQEDRMTIGQCLKH